MRDLKTMSSPSQSLPFKGKAVGQSRGQGDAKVGPGKLYLRLKVPAIAPQDAPGMPSGLSQSLLLSMDSVQEVLTLPVQRLSPMPAMPAPVLGLMNRGNRIFWLVDLALLMGLSRLEPNRQQHNVLILRAGASALGLAVSEVQPMIWIADEQLQSDVVLPNGQLKAFVSHGVNQAETSFWLLKEQSILQSPLLHRLGLESARSQ